MKISLSNVQIRKPLKTFQFDKEWAKMIYLEGIKPNLKIPSDGRIKQITFKTISPSKLLITCILIVTTEEIKQQPKKGSKKINVAWTKTLDKVPPQTCQINIKHIVERPKYMPPFLKVKKINPNHKVIQARSLINRIALKGKLSFQVEYYPDKHTRHNTPH